MDIRFPRDSSEGIVTIMGREDAVEDCEEHLLTLEEEYVSSLLFTFKHPIGSLFYNGTRRPIVSLQGGS